MEKSTGKTLVTAYVIVISLAFVLCIIYTPQITAYSNPTIKIPPESLAIQVSPANIKLTNGYYNVSVLVVNTGATAAQLQKFYVYRYENMYPLNRTIAGMTLYFNGTTVNPSQLDYNFESGDNLQVSFLIPCAEYAPNTNMSLTVYTSQALYGSIFALNWIA
jgi:hypothetical protein